MNKDELIQEICDVINSGDDPGYGRASIKLTRCQYGAKIGYELRVAREYSPVGLGLGKLMNLSRIFGTEEIDVDDFSHGGCETCDYGSEYGHEIQIYNPTKGFELLDELNRVTPIELQGE